MERACAVAPGDRSLLAGLGLARPSARSGYSVFADNTAVSVFHFAIAAQ